MRSRQTNYRFILFIACECLCVASHALAQSSSASGEISPSSATMSQPDTLLTNPANSTNQSSTLLPKPPANLLPVQTDISAKKLTGKTNTNVHDHYPRPTFAITGKFNRIFQKCTGITYISEVTTDYLAQRILKRKFGGKIKVTVKTYSFTDLIHLKVRIATVRMTGSHYKGIPLGKVEIRSCTPFWVGLGQHKRPSLQKPALLSFKAQVSDKELDQILHSDEVTNALRFLKLDLSSLGPGLDEQKLQMHEPELRLDDDLIVLKTTVATPNADPSTGSEITVSGKPKLHGEDLVYLEDVKVESPDITEPEKFSKFVENLINPLINLKRFDKYNFAVRLDDVSVKPKKLSIAGRIILSPSRTQTKSPPLPAALDTKSQLLPPEVNN